MLEEKTGWPTEEWGRRTPPLLGKFQKFTFWLQSVFVFFFNFLIQQYVEGGRQIVFQLVVFTTTLPSTPLRSKTLLLLFWTLPKQARAVSYPRRVCALAISWSSCACFIRCIQQGAYCSYFTTWRQSSLPVTQSKGHQSSSGSRFCAMSRFPLFHQGVNTTGWAIIYLVWERMMDLTERPSIFLPNDMHFP